MGRLGKLYAICWIVLGLMTSGVLFAGEGPGRGAVGPHMWAPYRPLVERA